MAKQVSEGSLHKWFKGSKSKDGKGGWVNVVTGGTCASDEPGEGTPKCVSSAKRASMTKAERLSAARRKKKADPGQQSKSGAAKPTYVSTDSPRKKKKKKMNEGWSDKYKQSIDCDNPKGFSQKAHCQGKKKMKETYQRSLTPLTEKAKKCWPGYEKKGTKKMFGKTYNNCVKKEEVEYINEKNKGDEKFIEGETGSKRARRDMTSAMNRSGMGYGKLGREQKERQERHKADRGKKTKGTKAGHSGSVYPKRSHTMDTMYPHKKTARLKAKAASMKKESYDNVFRKEDKKILDIIGDIFENQTMEAQKKTEVKPDPQLASKEKKANQAKKQVLMKKLQAVRMGAGSDIQASHEPKGEVVSELNRFEKEKGTDTKTGKPIQKGGSAKKDVAFQAVMKKYGSQRMGANQAKKVKGVKSDAGTGRISKMLAKKKQLEAKNKAFAARAKKEGQSTQDYANRVAAYGGEDNMKKGRGLGT